MAAHTTQDIRNIALVGHASVGKTTLTEALLKETGAIQATGTIERGDTVCDFDPQEKELQHSLDSALASLTAQGKHINLIDTPGYPDFLGRSLSVLPAVETAAIVVNAHTGLEMAAQRMMEAATERNLCRAIIVNKIDCANGDLPALMESIRETFGSECLPLNLPAEGGSKVIDCFFQPGGEATDFSSVSEAHTQIIDQVVEVDEKLMELYLEQGEELTPEQLHRPFEQALREGHLIPVCFVSATTGVGIPELLNIFTQLMPDPTEGNPPPFVKGEGDAAKPITVTPDAALHTIAHAFKIINDPFRGRLGIFRIHQGTVTPESHLFIGDARKAFKVGHLFQIQGHEQTEINRGIPGDICAVARNDEIHLDAVLHDSHDEDHHHLPPPQYPQPMFGLAIDTVKHGDEQKLSDALHKLQAEDPCFQVEHYAASNETVIRCLGELHQRIILQRITERYHVAVTSHPPSIAYRETICTNAEGHYRHKKQTGGAGQFGEVSLRIKPLERGAGFRFCNEVVGGSIPSQFIPAVEKGVRHVLDEGAIAGYPMQDIQVTVYEGKHHAVDSKEIAFNTAGKKAFLEAIKKAKPIILEPLVNIYITAPNNAIGDLTGDLSSRRGRICGTESLSSGQIAITGEVPLAELEDYESRLKSMTGGEGSYAIEFNQYTQAPGNVQKTLEKSFKEKV